MHSIYYLLSHRKRKYFLFLVENSVLSLTLTTIFRHWTEIPRTMNNVYLHNVCINIFSTAENKLCISRKFELNESNCMHKIQIHSNISLISKTGMAFHFWCKKNVSANVIYLVRMTNLPLHTFTHKILHTVTAAKIRHHLLLYHYVTLSLYFFNSIPSTSSLFFLLVSFTHKHQL